jgi:DNA-binding beta-propeller fold protein YncE
MDPELRDRESAMRERERIRSWALGAALLAALLHLGCQTEVPTWGEQVWGRDDGALEMIPIGSALGEIIVDPRRPYIYLSDFDASRLYFIAKESRHIEKEIVIGTRPMDLGFSMDGAQLYVALAGGSQIGVLDLDSQTMGAPIQLTFSPAYLAAGRTPFMYASSVLELWEGFQPQGQSFQVNFRDRTQLTVPQLRLLEINPQRTALFASYNRLLSHYTINQADGTLTLKTLLNAEGHIVELFLSEDGRRLYTISTGFLTLPEGIVTRGLIDSRKNFETDMVEVYSTDPLLKIGELHTGAFPRAVAQSGEYLVVAAADSSSTPKRAGFAVRYDEETLAPMQTFRLAGSPTSCAAVDSATGMLYVAIDNPYDLRERFGERQDLQVVDLRGSSAPAAGEQGP